MAVLPRDIYFAILVVFLAAVVQDTGVTANSEFEVVDEDALSCYSCFGYDDSAIEDCMENPDSVSTEEQCPTEVAGVQVYPACHQTKQTAAGKITSFTRGCMYHYNCTEILTCLNTNQTGVCVYCCDDDFCNTASSTHQQQWIVMATSLLLSFEVMRFLAR